MSIFARVAPLAATERETDSSAKEGSVSLGFVFWWIGGGGVVWFGNGPRGCFLILGNI